jgi:SOS-response transcriptional repressor LexA
MNVQDNQSDRYIEVTVFRIKGDGDLMELAKFEPIDTILVPKELYQTGFVVIQNRGDSMEKLIMDGANVVIDTTSREIISGSIYALSIPWEGCILRECHSEPHGVLLRPYNKNYPVSTIGWEEFDPNMVMGKVFCSIMNVFR